MTEEKNMEKDRASAKKEPKNKNKINKEKAKAEKEASGQNESGQQKIMELEKNVEELNDKYLRLYSEFDNYRKRTLKEKIELSKSAAEDLMVSLLPVVDDLERALKAMEAQDDPAKEGIDLIYNKFKNILEQKGLKSIDALGQDFDVDYHEALTSIPATEDKKGKVVDVIEKGYLLNDKVIRYSKVVVGQ